MGGLFRGGLLFGGGMWVGVCEWAMLVPGCIVLSLLFAAVQ
jgi:hypothetical protein